MVLYIVSGVLLLLSVVSAYVAYAYYRLAQKIDDEELMEFEEWTRHYGWTVFFQGLAVGFLASFMLTLALAIISP